MALLRYIRERWAPALNVLLGLLLVAPMSPHNAEVILCVEANGEVNVERARAGECAETNPAVAETSTHQQNEEWFTSTRDDHCLDCVDVSLHLTSASDPCTSFARPAPAFENDFAFTSLAADFAATDRFVAQRDRPDPTSSVETSDRCRVRSPNTSSLRATSSVVLLI